jgi:phosphotransacetylase
MEKNPFISIVREKAKGRFATVAFPDAEDKRTLETSIFLLNEKIANPVLVGNKEKIEKVAETNGLNISEIQIFEPSKSEFIPEFASLLYEKRKSKGMTEEKAVETVLDPLYFAGYLLETGRVD